ncbi:MAG: CPBP family intramembrane metalloprotease [Thermoplasmatales archaeon]|nr:CPBP family intramembrane metalloprotease [Thermoplasmatales archaeon]
MKKIIAYLVLFFALAIIYSSVVLSFFVNLDVEISYYGLISGLILNFLIMFIPSIVFAYLYYEGNVLNNLYFRKEGAIKSVSIAISATLIFIFLQGIFLFIIGYKESNPLAEKIVEIVKGNLFLLFLIPVISSISEETFYRGIIQNLLQEKIGVYSIFLTSIIFAIAHIEYKTIFQFLMPFLFGILLGFLMYKFKNIFAPISAHFFYNFLSLFFSLLYG